MNLNLDAVALNLQRAMVHMEDDRETNMFAIHNLENVQALIESATPGKGRYNVVLLGPLSKQALKINASVEVRFLMGSSIPRARDLVYGLEKPGARLVVLKNVTLETALKISSRFSALKVRTAIEEVEE